ncbi:chaplin [Streptomyces roseolilacinus]|uniref:Membrane protein n=1 Tax=Streptomyces roseolilacinus TaxID=66904 RepID=A0A918B4J1_9ACTN|nr:chaplin [Streptomyces roseolilacinus]GGQ28501.1 membrane protein [Streptomyces roseolilacinus]
MSRIAKAATVVAGTGAVTLAGVGTAAAVPGLDAVTGSTSGRTVQVPLHSRVGLCGETTEVVGVLNPAFGNVCANPGEPRRGG